MIVVILIDKKAISNEKIYKQENLSPVFLIFINKIFQRRIFDDN
jgi:hypothetical protein